MEKVDLAYLAGLIDGEGCIYVDKHKDKRNKTNNSSYCLRLKINNTCEKMVDWLMLNFREFNPCSFACKGKEYDEGRRTCYEIKFNGKNAINLLKLVKDFLITKHKQCEYALEFEETIYDNTRKRNGRFAPGDPDIMKKKEKIYQKIKNLNQRKEG